MSLRAIRKRETRPYRKQQNHDRTQKIIVEPNINVESWRSRSYPDLTNILQNVSLSNGNRTGSQSESDVSKAKQNSKANNNLVPAKSEVCLKTISVHRTVHADMSRKSADRNISDLYRGDVINNNRLRRMSDHSLSAYSQTSSFTSTSEYTGRGFSDTSCIRIPIIGYEVMEERARFTVYKLRVENPFSNSCWLVLRRYTDFVRLNNKLKQTFPQINLQLPRKKIFGDNFNSVFLDNRVQGLQMFVNTVMSNNELRNSKIVREFFCLDEPPTYSESMEECRAIFEAQEETIAHLKLQLKNKDELILSLQQKLRAESEQKTHLQEELRNRQLCSNCSTKLVVKHPLQS
uniref:Putative sorting nexin 16 n=1 Tax=Tabanus bromius TaxID=304241 RepID=A0A0K8TM13_TABBR